MGGIVPVIVLAVIFFLIMYFAIVRPVQQRNVQHDDMVEELQKGDEVITAGGIYGKVDTIYEDTVILKVESGATIRVAKGGIVKRVGGEDIDEFRRLYR